MRRSALSELAAALGGLRVYGSLPGSPAERSLALLSTTS